jgi:DNA-binding transcriptional MerR regulator
MQTQTHSPVFNRLFAGSWTKNSKTVKPSLKKNPKTIPDPDRTYSSREAAVLTGCTLRQLQWWDEKRLARPEAFTSNRRQYSANDIRRIKDIARLRKCGVSLQAVRYILKTAAFITEARFILIEGKRAWPAYDEKAAIAVLRATNKPMFLVDRGE